MTALSISPLQPDALSAVLVFIGSWSEDDAYDRFGLLGDAGPRWLANEFLENASRRALLARRVDRVIGLLDYIEADGAMHFGVIVARDARRKHVGTALVRAFLGAKPPSRSATAECRPDNRAAIGLLRSSGFTRRAFDACEIAWSHP